MTWKVAAAIVAACVAGFAAALLLVRLLAGG